MPFAIALAVSAVLHAAAIVMPGWTLPGDAETEPQTIDAQLTTPAPPVAAKPKPRARPARRPPAAESPAEDPAPAVDTAGATPESTEKAAGEAAPAVASPAPPPSPPWPQRGRLRYVVTYGDNGFIIGETVQEWRIEDGRYSIRSVAEPRGLAVLRGRTRTQASEGEVTPAGLRPSEFRDQREGREPEVASFDWPAGQANFLGGRPPGRLAEGAQDMVSVFYQLAWLAPRQDVELSVATGSRVGRWKFEWVGEESLELPSGTVATLHLRTRSDGDTTEVWLAPAFGGLPVKIRHVDRKGDAFEQIAGSPENN